MFLIKNGS